VSPSEIAEADAQRHQREGDREAEQDEHDEDAEHDDAELGIGQTEDHADSLCCCCCCCCGLF
jgi:hypothetical protein